MKELKETLNELKEQINNEEPKDTIVPNWEGMYMGLKAEYEEMKKAYASDYEEMEKSIHSYEQYIKQQEITIRMLASMLNK